MDINKIIARKELEVIGGKPKVYRYWDEYNEKSVDILSCIDRPYYGVSSYATIGLSEHDIGMLSETKKLRVELIGACDSKEEKFENILSTVAFEIIEKSSCKYGDIIPNVISQYINDCDMKHIYLMNPFLWDEFEVIEFNDIKVTWLMIVPISSQEKEYAINSGWEELEQKFEEANVDIFNLNRKSVL